VGYDELVSVKIGVDEVKQEVGLFEASTLASSRHIGKIGVDMVENDG